MTVVIPSGYTYESFYKDGEPWVRTIPCDICSEDINHSRTHPGTPEWHDDFRHAMNYGCLRGEDGRCTRTHEHPS